MKLSKSLLAIALGAVLTSSGWAADEAGKGATQTTIDKVPAAVKDAINGSLEGGTIKGITEVKKDDKTLYHVEITTKDGKTESKWFNDKGEAVKHHKGDPNEGKGEHEGKDANK